MILVNSSGEFNSQWKYSYSQFGREELEVQGPKEREIIEIFRIGSTFYLLALYRNKEHFVKGN